MLFGIVRKMMAGGKQFLTVAEIESISDFSYLSSTIRIQQF